MAQKFASKSKLSSAIEKVSSGSEVQFMAGIDGIAGRLLFRPIRIHGRSRAPDEKTDGRRNARWGAGEGVCADLSGEVEVAVEKLQREHEEEDEDRRQGHGRRRRRSEAEPGLSALRSGWGVGTRNVSPQIDRTGPTRVPGCTSSRQWRDVRARGPSGGFFFF